MYTRFISRPSALLAATLALTAVAAPAGAGLLEPGQTGGGEDFVFRADNPSFAGETLESTSTPFELTRVDDTGRTQFFRGTFNHRVVRESQTGRLAFHYEFLRGASNTELDFENFIVRGFASFTTDVFSDQTNQTQARASRSADGDEIDFVGDETRPAILVVRTDATDFEDGGNATLVAAFQPDSVNQGQSFNTFAPAADDPGPTPNPIPLPPAAWAAFSTMGAFGALKKLRRRG